MSQNTSPLPAYADAPLLLLISAFLMMQPLSTDLYLASLPSLASGFGVPISTVQLTLSLFVIGFGGAQLAIGPLSDRFGRRPVLLYGLALYVIASALCGLAQSITLLIAARFLQAVGCCSAVIVARAIVRDAYAPEDSVRVIAKASTWLSVAPIFGPILGSYLQVAFGWRAAFVSLGIFSACLLALTFLRLPETNTHKNPRATDRTFRAGSAIALATGLLFLGAVLAGIAHWSLLMVAMFLTMVAHGISFPIVQAGSVSPFQHQAGTAAGLMGGFYMVVALLVGTVVGATANGTLYPLALISCTLGVLIFSAVRVLPGAVPKTA